MEQHQAIQKQKQNSSDKVAATLCLVQTSLAHFVSIGQRHDNIPYLSIKNRNFKYALRVEIKW